MNDLSSKCMAYLKTLCIDIGERCVGSNGNKQSTLFFERTISSFGWKTEQSEFDAMDWKNGGATLHVDDSEFEVLASPYALGCKSTAQLVSAASTAELEGLNAKNKILFLHGEIAKEPLMPKNFVFYNPEKHKKIVALLEKSEALAIICATGRNEMAGGVYPFPMIEDGDFDIPSVYMTEEEGAKLIPLIGKQAVLESFSQRIPSNGYNVIGRIGSNHSERIVITAHIDAKKGSPGAIDNATGVVILLLLAELISDYQGKKQIEIVALNGEDYYAVPGQMKYVKENEAKFENILLNINIDGAGYKEGASAFSFFNLPEDIKETTDSTLDQYVGIVEGIPWPQGDHSIFIQYGRPAIAVSSKWLIDNFDKQEITHTIKDNLDIVDCAKLVEIAKALNSLIRIL